MKRTTYERFDVVAILTTKNVTFRTDLPGTDTKIDGYWHIIGCFPKSGTLLISKGTGMCIIPAADVVKVANYELQHVFKKLENTHGIRQKRRKETN